MAKYIHVITATKVPDILSASWTDPFQDFETDPNVGGFGSDERTMWLPVIEPARPADTPADRYDATYTDDTDGNSTRGVYVAGPPDEWHFTWAQTARTLEEAKAYQQGQLEGDYQTRLALGYVDDGPGGSGKTFELSNDNFGTIVNKRSWYNDALASGVIQGGRKASVFAKDSTRVQFQNFNQFGVFVDRFGLSWDDINEHKYVTADAIEGALNVTQVDNVTWDFSAL